MEKAGRSGHVWPGWRFLLLLLILCMLLTACGQEDPTPEAPSPQVEENGGPAAAPDGGQKDPAPETPPPQAEESGKPALGSVVIEGYDAARVEYHWDGWLYYAIPTFLGEPLAGLEMEGIARWTDETHSAVEVSFTEKSSLDDGGTINGPARRFTVDVEQGTLLTQSSVDYEGDEPTPMTEEQMIRVGLELAGIMAEAESGKDEQEGTK